MTVEDERLAALVVSARRQELAAMVKRGRPAGGDTDDLTITNLARAAAARHAAAQIAAAAPPFRPKP